MCDSPFPAHCSGPSHFLGEFVAEEPHRRPSAKGWRWGKWAWRWRASKWGRRSTSRTDGWGWWRWSPPRCPTCQPGHGGKHLEEKKKNISILSGYNLLFMKFCFLVPHWKHTPLMLAFMPPPPEPWECPCPPCPCPPCPCPCPPWEWPWPPWLCSLWEWPWCEWPWSLDEQLLPPCEWAWLKAQIPTRLTSKPPTDTGCRRQKQHPEFRPSINHLAITRWFVDHLAEASSLRAHVWMRQWSWAGYPDGIWLRTQGHAVVVTCESSSMS